jgi:hypothetical protein
MRVALAMARYMTRTRDPVTCCIDQCMTSAWYGRARPHVTRL